jgi:hypothetical protein
VILVREEGCWDQVACEDRMVGDYGVEEGEEEAHKVLHKKDECDALGCLGTRRIARIARRLGSE